MTRKKSIPIQGLASLWGFLVLSYASSTFAFPAPVSSDGSPEMPPPTPVKAPLYQSAVPVSEPRTSPGASPHIARNIAKTKTGEVDETSLSYAKDLDPGTVRDGFISMEFRNADIKSVLNVLSTKGNVNIVIDQEVLGGVTMRLIDVPWEKALDMVIRSGGYVYERDGNIYRVTTPDKLEREDLKTRVFHLVYANAADVVSGGQEIGATNLQGISGLLSDRGTIRFDERSNVLIVSDTASSLSRVAEVIEKLDTETKQVLIESKLIETTLDDDFKTGIDWNVQLIASGTGAPWTFPFPRRGLRSGFFPEGSPDATQPQFARVGETGRVAGVPSVMPAQFSFGTLNATGLSATLDMLKRNDRTRILSNPTLITLDNKSASIKVGRQDPVPAYSFNSDTGSWEITGFLYEDSGVEMEVTPQINKDEQITLRVHPRVRENIGTAEFPSGGSTADVPIFTVREAVTEVIVPNNHSMVIGGLIQRKTVDTKKKVPLFGSIPVLGRVFSHKAETEDTIELIIFLTPRIAQASPTEEMAREYFLPLTLKNIAKEKVAKTNKKKRKKKREKHNK